MTIFVDELLPWKGRGRTTWCHMMVDTPGPEGLSELHAFAAKIGLKRSWFQSKNARSPHYDLTPAKRSAAIAFGAQPVVGSELIRRCVWERNGETHEPPPNAPDRPPAAAQGVLF